MDSKKLLTEVKSVFIVDMMRYVYRISKMLEGKLIEPQKGIYIINSLEPVIKNDQLYYSESSFKLNKPIESLDNVREAVLNEFGGIVIPKHFMCTQKRLLSTEPTLPVVALSLLELLCKQYVDSLLMFGEAQDFDTPIKALFKPEYSHLVDDGYAEAFAQNLLNDVSRFIGADVWNMYFIKRRNTDLIIEKGVDWRIYAWTLEQENKSC